MLLTKTDYIKALKIVLKSGKEENVQPNTMCVFHEDKEYLLLWQDYIYIGEIFRDKNVVREKDSLKMAEIDYIIFFIKEKNLNMGLAKFWDTKIHKLAKLQLDIEGII